MSVCGNPRLNTLVNRAIKQHFGVNCPYVIVVIEPNQQNAGVHSNMDRPEERVSLMQQTTDHCRAMSSGLVLPGHG